jgi:hypothetical protein
MRAAGRIRPRPAPRLVSTKVADATTSRAMFEHEEAIRRIELEIGDSAAAPTSEDVFDVTTHGATGFGVHDDSVSILRAAYAASQNYTATGRLSVVWFPSGVYGIRKPSVSTLVSIDLNGMSGIIFAGPPGGSARLRKIGTGNSDTWYMLWVRNSVKTWFLDLTLDGGGEVDIDAVQEQQHLLNVGPAASEVVIRDCVIRDEWGGDGLRLVGDPGQWVQDIEVSRTRFIDCKRTAIAFQRYCRRVRIHGCHFYGGTDQHIDFETSNYIFVCDAGGSSTLINDAAAQFVTWGVEVGDVVRNQTTGEMTAVTAVLSQTQLTTRALVSGTWSTGVQYSFLSNNDHRFTDNYFDHTRYPDGVEITVTLSAACNTVFSNNTLEAGTIQATDTFQLQITDNVIVTGRRGDSNPAIDLIANGGETVIAGNTITTRNSGTTERRAISVTHNGSQAARSVSIRDNTIRCETSCTVGAIRSESVKHLDISGNTIVKAENNASSIGISVRAVFAMDVVRVTDNRIYTEAGWANFTKAIQLAALSTNITTCAVGGGELSGCVTGISFEEGGGGVFANPPLVLPTVNNATTTAMVLPPATPWVVLGGFAGSAPQAFAPKWYFGDGSPETVVSAPVGSIASRRNGGAGTSVYAKQTGTGNTGWLAFA